MRTTLAVLSLFALSAAAQNPAVAPLTLEQKETFLRTAKIVAVKQAKKGVTGTHRATLSDGTITHDASIQIIDVEQGRFETPRGIELHFRDTWKFNVAAFKLARLLGLEGMTPVSVERMYEGRHASYTWWIENVQMDEVERMSKKLKDPDTDRWSRQYLIMKVFDQLICNVDRNAQNILYDKTWRLWMIDHSRAFRIATDIRDPKALQRCDRELLAKMKTLTEDQLTGEFGDLVRSTEVKALLARRDKIVTYFEKRPEKLYVYLPLALSPAPATISDPAAPAAPRTH